MNNDVIDRMLIAFYPRFKTATQFSEINRIGMTAAARVLLADLETQDDAEIYRLGLIAKLKEESR
jgi:hypothetical protein